MKRSSIIISIILLVTWGISFFIFHAGPAIHTLVGLAILFSLHSVLIRDTAVSFPDKMILEIKHFWYIKVFKRIKKENPEGENFPKTGS